MLDIKTNVEWTNWCNYDHAINIKNITWKRALVDGSKQKTLMAMSDLPALAIFSLTAEASCSSVMSSTNIGLTAGSSGRASAEPIISRVIPCTQRKDTQADEVTNLVDFNEWVAKSVCSKKSLLQFPKYICDTHIFQLNVSPLIILEWRR